MRFITACILYLMFTSQVIALETIPGPRDCFWSRGPVSSDPYINIAYPDANVFYWAAAFSTPEESTLEIMGDSLTHDTCHFSAMMKMEDQLNH